jgi:ribosomal-protein-alanine N-acetyltransferase
MKRGGDEGETLQVLPMRPTDLDAVCSIAEASFPVPWTRGTFLQEIERDWAVTRVIKRGRVPELCGFIAYWVVSDEIHLHNIAVRSDLRRRGYAGELLRDMVRDARERSVRTIWLEVRGSNRAAIDLYRGLGFEKAGVRRNYYADNDEDAVIMALRLQDGSTDR